MTDLTMIIPLTEWIAASLLIAVSACLQGVSGIGFGMVAAPILAIVHPELVPGPMLFLGLVIAVMAVLREPADLDRRGLAFALAGRLPTSILAAILIGVLPVKALGIVFAAIILGGVALSLARVPLGPTPGTLLGAGLLSGFMGTITSVGLPPVALVYQGVPASTLRATIGGYLAIGTVISIAALATVGRFGVHDMALGLWLVVPMSLGFWVSTPLARRMPQRMVRMAVLGLSATAALILLARQFAA
ncbi:sulfite exporter TauE/SafE family protein [Kaustia mangrovi]|nr:sulfite exporter TauE/SafE family protein [Kaustia mangrovi]